MANTTVDPAKEELSKHRHFSFRLNFFFLAIFLLFSILIVRLALLQFVEGKALSEEESNKSIMQHSIPPIRGTIFDQKGYPIAESTSTQSVFYTIEPGKADKDAVVQLAYKLEAVFRDYGDAKQAIAAEDIIKRMDVGYDLNKKATKEPGYYSQPRRLKADLINQEIAYLSEHRDEFPGVEIQEESIRHYNDKTIAVQLVGYLKSFSSARNKDGGGLDFYRKKAESKDPTVEYLDSEEVGYDGIEYLFQDELRGKNGIKTYPVNAAQKIVGPVSLTKPDKGNNVYLTINKDIQLETETAIVNHLQTIRSLRNDVWRYAPNATTGYAVAMEVDTGNVVAMASMPDYNSNIWHGGISTEDYNQIQYQYLNGAISEVYANYSDSKERAKHPTSLVYMGSTIKPLSILIGLKEGIITANETYNDTGRMTFGKDNTTINNSDGHAWGPINAWQAIWRSSNTYMSEMIGLRLYNRYRSSGTEMKVWDDYMKEFGLGVKTGSGLRYESAGIADYNHEAKNASPQSALVRASWGQMGKYTTLQLAQFTAMLGNRGKRLKPNFVDKLTTYDNQLIKTFQPEVLNEVSYPKDYWDTIQRGMLLVNKDGFDGVAYTVAAKTGTSTQSIARQEINNAVFIAYAPAEKPKLAVAVVVPEGGYGAYGAAPIARKIFDAYDREVGLYGTPNPNSGVSSVQ
ncbi:peptidoglycan D,D-transpeptidase FtsI family protein [Paenibacillus koleovorans]|uniref:peptidoglycan D,D-transpeptidase FtsI family protein n=1 Tax=Paenibacillus koleovorans TaxID=121608 RepID=UPI000FD9EE06|nr:penicillin-binding transpeptidase domain-containing protein [Paenibacillus koleovorans]